MINVGLCLEHHWQHDFHRLDIEHCGLQTPLTFPPAALRCLLVEWHNFMLRQTQMPISNWSSASLRLKNCSSITFMWSGTRSAIIVLALPQCHCGCSEASVLRQHTTEVCSGSSKVPLQHGQDPPLAPVSVRHIATVMVLMIEIAKLRNTCHVDFLAIQKTCSLVWDTKSKKKICDLGLPSLDKYFQMCSCLGGPSHEKT